MKEWLQRSILRVAMNALILSLIANQVNAQATLVARWTFEGDATDVSGNGYDGELLGSAEFSTSAKQGSQCLYLEGSSSCVNAGEIDLGDEFSVAAWVYLDFSDEEPRDIQTIVANCEGGALVDGFKVYVNDWETSNHRIRVEAANISSRKDAITAEDVFEEEYWNHVAVTVDVLEGLVEIFYNGEDITSDGICATDFQTAGEFWIGAMHATNYPWGGMIDDVRLFEGILTEEEIAAIMSDIASDVQEPVPVLPAAYTLGENYPNPFNPATIIPYTLARTSDIRLEVFDQLGQLVQVLVDEVQSPGTYEAHFSAQNMASGIYFYKLTADSYINLKKMVLVK